MVVVVCILWNVSGPAIWDPTGALSEGALDTTDVALHLRLPSIRDIAG